MRTLKSLFSAVAAVGVLSACGVPDGDPGEVPLDVPDTYTFTEKQTSESTVSYSGQVLRNVLITDMKTHLSGLTARIDNGTLVPTAGKVKAELDFFYKFDGAVSGDVTPLFNPKVGPSLQTKYSEIGNANLYSKIAGRDDVEKQHKNWNTQLIGWPGANSPDALVQSWMQKIDEQAVARASGTVPMGADGKPIASVFITQDGLALHELLQKFLTGAVNYSQAADDYLDEGLNDDNTKKVEGQPYTALEHAWDEGFGYFGASRDYLKRSDDEIAAAAAFDTNADGKIDLKSEMTFDHAGYASKRDRASAANARTDFSGEAMRAFLRGRAVISGNGTLTPGQRAQLTVARDEALSAWERTLAASAIHYLNGVLKDMELFGTSTYSFSSHASHFSEMKGFALALQFNPRKQISDADLLTFHEKVGTAPVLPNQAGIAEYKGSLIQARALLQASYGFDAANIGDGVGLNGW